MDVNAALKVYRKFLNAKKDLKNYTDVSHFAGQAGVRLFTSLGIPIEELVEMPEEELVLLLDPMFKAMTTGINSAANVVQNRINRKAGLDLLSLEVEYNPVKARRIAAGIVGGKTQEDLVKDIVTEAYRTVDDHIRVNAQAHADMGLETHIVRTYSDRGLHHGTKWAEPCQVCLDRAGEWTSYSEAYAAGAFKRHDGCQCEIEYKVGKTHTRSRDKHNWWSV